MSRTRPPYPPEFRRQIVELVPGVREVAQEFEPSYETIREWVRQANRDDPWGQVFTFDRGDGMTRIVMVVTV